MLENKNTMDTEKHTRPQVVVIGSADVIKLCVIRALGTFGCDVDVVHLSKVPNKRMMPVDYYSKFVRHYFLVNSNNLIQFLLEKYHGFDTKVVVFTLDDNSTALIDNAQEQLGSIFHFAHLKSGQHIVSMMNKHLLKEKAARVGMNVVAGWPIPYENGEFYIPDGIQYPCFVKGLFSNYNSKHVQCQCKDEQELRHLLDSCKKHYPYSVYAEEFIPIEKDFGVIGVCDGKKCIIPARADLLVLGKGSTNGVSMLGKVSPFDKNTELYKQIESMLADLRYVGIFNFDFVESKGKIFFVELNFRFAAYGYGVFCAGVNLPAMFVRSVLLGQFNEDSNEVTSLNQDYYYLNEKIVLTNVLEKSITWSKYRVLKKQADFLLVNDSGDPKPYKMFKRTFVLKYIKKTIGK